MGFIKFLINQPVYLLWLYLALIILATFAVFGIDKLKAIKGAWRIPEKTLLTLCAVGGSLGGLAGIYVFHHKTLHKKFTVGVPLILAVQVILLVLLDYFVL